MELWFDEYISEVSGEGRRTQTGKTVVISSKSCGSIVSFALRIQSDCSSSRARILVTTSFFPSLRKTTSSSDDIEYAMPNVSRGSCWMAWGRTGGIYAFFLGSAFNLAFSFPLGFFCFGMGGFSTASPAATAAFFACFFRVAELADDLWFFTIVALAWEGFRMVWRRERKDKS